MANWWDTSGSAAWGSSPSDSTPQQEQDQPQTNWWDNSGSDSWNTPAPVPTYYTPAPAAPTPAKTNPFDFSGIFGVAGQALQTGLDYNQSSSYDYNPETPFTITDYQQPQPQVPAFQSDGSVSDMYAQESQLPTVTYDQYGSPISHDPTAPFDLNGGQPTTGASSWNQTQYPEGGGTFGGSNDWGSNAGSVSAFDTVESQQAAPASGTPAFTQQDLRTRPVMPYEEGYNPETGGMPNPAALFGPVRKPGQVDVLGELGGTADTISKAGLNVLGAPFAVAGSAIAGAAGANIPVISPVAQAGQWFQQQVISPAANLFASTAGALSQGGDILDFAHGAGPAGALVGGAVDLLQGRDPTQYYRDVAGQLPITRFIQGMDKNNQVANEQYRQQQAQAVYDNALAQGQTPDQAQKAAQQVYSTLANPFNMAEQPGLQQFGQLPAVAQLGLSLIDPVGNRVMGAEIKPLTEGVPHLVGKAAEKTGATQLVDNLLENTVRPGSQKAYLSGLVSERIANTLNNVAEDVGTTATDVLPTFLFDATSPYFHEKVISNYAQDPRAQQVITDLQRAYEASPLYKPGSRSDTAAPGEANFARDTQDTTGTAKPVVSQGNKYSPPDDTYSPEVIAQNAQSLKDFDAIGTEPDATNPVPANKQPWLTAPEKPLGVKYNGVKLPYRDTADASEFFNTAKTLQGIDVKALVPDGNAAKPAFRPAKMLEEWGALGKAIRGVNRYTVAPLSNLFLESGSRFVRDPAGNVIKQAVENPEVIRDFVSNWLYGNKTNSITSRYEAYFGKGVESLGPSTMSGDNEYRRSNTTKAKVIRHFTNPINEPIADAVRFVSGGKIPSLSEGIEQFESGIKSLDYQSRAIKAKTELIKQQPLTDFFKANPELRQKVLNREVSVEQVQDMLAKNIYNGFDANDLINGTYNPAMPSDTFKAAAPGVAEGTAGSYGDVLYKGISSLVDRVKEQNEVNLINELQNRGFKVYGGDLSKVNPKVVARAKQAVKQIEFSDLDSNHPLVQQMAQDVKNGYDANRITLFPQDKIAYQAAQVLVNQAINYAADSRRFDLLAKSLNDIIAAKEPAYAIKYKGPPTDFQRMMALKDKYEATAGLTPQEIRQLPAGQRITPKEIAEYEAWRDSMPLRQQAADSGVELPVPEEGATTTLGLPQATPQPKADYTPLYDQVHNPPAVRFDTGAVRGGKRLGVVLTPVKMQEMAGKLNRTETFKSNGDVFNADTSRKQVNRWTQDMLATDEYYRKISNNTFKLDPETLAPVRIADGASLEELMGQPRPPRIGPQTLDLSKTMQDAGLDPATTDIRQLGEMVKKAYGEDGTRDFSQMDPALRDAIFQDASKAILGIDPLNPLTNPKGNQEHGTAMGMLQAYLEDMDQRKTKWQEGKAADQATVQKGKDLQQQVAVKQKEFMDAALAERFKVDYEAKRQAYYGTKGVYFDYRDKNRIDQVLGTVLPFQYWARQNFAYLARYFAKNPYQFTAILNFYKQLEKQNSDPTIPGFAKFSIHLGDIPGTSIHVMYEPASLIPFIPLGSSDTFGGLAMKTDDDLVRDNTTNANPDGPLGIFDPGFWFGKDITKKDPKTGKMVVTGRDKGLLPSFFRPNTAIQDVLETGLFNKAVQGVTGNKDTLFGQDYTEANRAQHADLGILPAGQIYAAAAAATGAADKLRQAGVIKGEFNPLQPLNEIAYGRNAGKPQTAIFQEINRMVVNKEITADEGKLAIASFKDGSYNSGPLLSAMDRVYADTIGQKAMSIVGFPVQIFNTPRQQITSKLYADESAAYAGTPTGYKLDDKGNAVSAPGAVSQFYKDNPAASVLSTEQANDTPESIKAGIADDKTRAAADKLKAQQKDGTLDYRTYSSEMDKLKGANPTFFDKNSYYDNTVGEQKYYEKLDAYKAIGGDNFDKMQTDAFAAKDKGDDATYKKIVNSPEYKAANNQRLDFMLANPDFQKQYTSNNDQYARERTQEVVGGVGRSNPQLAPKPQKTVDDLQYTKTTNDYYDVGGDKFDQMQAQAYAAKDKGDDATFKKILASPEYRDAQNKRNQFIFDHPDWYQQFSDNKVSKGGVGNYSGPLPPTKADASKLQPTVSNLLPNAPKSIPDIKYSQQLSDYYSKGGDEYDKLVAQKNAYFDKKEDAKAYAIINSRDYQRVQSTLDQFKLDNPDFAKRYDAEYTAKYGKPPASEADKIYDSQRASFYNIGGAWYDQQTKKISDLFDAGKSSEAYDLQGKIDYQRVVANRQQFMLDNPDFADRYNKDYEAKNGKPPKSLDDQVYSQQQNEYYGIGKSINYDQLKNMVSDYFDAKNSKAAYAISDTKEYQDAKAARAQYLKDHPDFAKRWTAENEAKYGPSNTGSSSSAKSSTASSSSSGGSTKYTTSKKTTLPTTYKAKSYTTYKPYTTSKASSSSAYKPAANSNTTASGKVTNPFKLPITDSRNPFYLPTSGNTNTAKNITTQNRSTTNTNTNTQNKTVTSSSPTAAGGNSASTWDNNQKKAYAQSIAKGKSKSYAAKVANNYYQKKPWQP